ncbi:ribulose-phosphate 3-epimerase [Lactobacillus helveticus]|uniref:Ribulose-phosphate 3-epimerase n=1 Tax=Lactobacillus helveticus CIRM-BIA 104 TaxID=1226333 RepID=U6FCT7_LACHE|nr:ribulose-phosphate 3-epimerase [Lactobacillus helveticus]KXN77515.1 ribulose phosphate epimerase [Lactobacillus helveticus]MCT3424121.1 ribulose-phosphate 3-epimerase [Lactobacillus helveticus]NHL85390.1 ribulose-phosphate 3-epimerase [Lactobacillus helveticus]NHL95916.1 ribulose-phosphate 3-epimerase [Lactobacillus helveticus]CDI60855.1 Ribulose-phosphate 3-epimerase [Lactobacillus helveticus CIRM-BIA 104]
MIIAPSILNADNLNLKENIKEAVAVGIDRFHIDIMDGHFVPNLSFGPQLISDFKREFPMIDAEIHFMSNNPDDLIPAFVAAGADIMELHYGAMSESKLNYWLDYLASNGVETVLAIKPDIQADVIEKFLPKIKQVLVMTVNPGFGGQSFIADSAEKIKQVREIVGPNMPIEVDGGINDRTIKIAKDAGADVFVVGSYLYKNGNITNQVRKLEKIIK